MEVIQLKCTNSPIWRVCVNLRSLILELSVNIHLQWILILYGDDEVY